MENASNNVPARRVYGREDGQALRTAVTRIVEQTPVTDVHTHLYSPVFGELLLYGVDELLTYHYLEAETIRASGVRPDQFYEMSKSEQADLVWEELFVRRSPVSEACRGVLTALDRLGLDVAARDLGAYRSYFADVDLEKHVDTVFERAGLTSVVMTNDPFDKAEHAVWENEVPEDDQFRTALRIDPLLLDWRDVCPELREWGYDADMWLTPNTLEEIRRFLRDWLARTRALYMAVSLPPTFRYPHDADYTKLLDECILPVAREHNIPFAMMIGVKRKVNPALKLAGDGVGRSGVGAVERLCAAYPSNKFMVTMLSREDQHSLCVAARKFQNLLLFGCWWFLNNPSLIEEMTRMRLELLGLSVIPQHSDARVLEQVVYKWAHSRAVIANVLADKYVDLAATGWVVDESEIERDVAGLLGGYFWDFLK